jgi:hypothetical protein
MQRSPADGFSGLIFKRMTDIEKGFANNSDDRRFDNFRLASSNKGHPILTLSLIE